MRRVLAMVAVSLLVVLSVTVIAFSVVRSDRFRASIATGEEATE